MQILIRFRWPILLALIGVALNIAGAVLLAGLFRDTGTSFLAPGEVSVTITKPGDYVLWHETRTILDGQFMSFSDDLPSGTTIRVFAQPEGTPVPLRTRGVARMEWAGTRRVSVGELAFPSAGRYRVVVAGLAEQRAFYLDESKFLRMFLVLMVFIVNGILFLLAAVGIGIYVFYQASQAAALRERSG